MEFELSLSDLQSGVVSEALTAGTGVERLAGVNVNVWAAVMTLKLPMPIS